MAVDQQEYFKDWYKKNRETLSDKRKNRYHSDPAYAAAAKLASKMRRIQVQADKKKERVRAGLPVDVTGGGPRKPVPVVLPSGKVVDGFTIGEVARRIGKTYFALKRWRYLGVLPKSPLQTEAGHGLYTEKMIDVLKSAVSKRIDVHAKDKTFTEEVEKGWAKALSS